MQFGAVAGNHSPENKNTRNKGQLNRIINLLFNKQAYKVTYTYITVINHSVLPIGGHTGPHGGVLVHAALSAGC
jgi:hypothetical protein